MDFRTVNDFVTVKHPVNFGKEVNKILFNNGQSLLGYFNGWVSGEDNLWGFIPLPSSFTNVEPIAISGSDIKSIMVVMPKLNSPDFIIIDRVF